MYDVPREYADIVMNDIEAREGKLWRELVKIASSEYNTEKCRDILKAIDLNRANSVLLWRV